MYYMKNFDTDPAQIPQLE